jgi:hypothetical protein
VTFHRLPDHLSRMLEAAQQALPPLVIQLQSIQPTHDEPGHSH